ncbi:MAG: hypothetical protein JO272_17245 [Pseudonocardiales bacterium]|nr:hypothetical protein [Pseudonocardiales bacterium]
MERARLTGLDLSYHTEGLPDRDSYLTVASACLNDALPGDTIMWGGIDLAKLALMKVWFNEAEAYLKYGGPDMVQADWHTGEKIPTLNRSCAPATAAPIARSDRVG